MPVIRWEDHPAQVVSVIRELYNNSEFTDCLLDVQEGVIHGHKIILAACSPYLKKLLMDHHGKTIIPFKEVRFKDMKLILDFIYLGEADVPLVDVASLMDTAEFLQISSLRCATHHFAEESVTAADEDRAIRNKNLLGVREDKFDSIGQNVEVISVKGPKRNAIYVLKHLSERGEEDQVESDVISSVKDNNVRDESLSNTFVVVPPKSEERGGEDDEERGGGGGEEEEDKKEEEQGGAEEEEDEDDEERGGGGEEEDETCVQTTEGHVASTNQSGTCDAVSDCDATNVVEGLEEQYEAIHVISESDLVEENEMDTSVGVEETQVVHESSSLGEEEEILNGQSQDTYLIPYEPLETEGPEDGENADELELKEAVELLDPRDQMEVDYDAGKPFPCAQCPKRFATAEGLKAHKRYHSGVKPFLCSVCGAAFVEKSNLVRHFRRHTGEKPFRCGVCGAAFREGGSLTKHRRLHTGEKPYRCDVCGQAYRLRGSFKYHMAQHAGRKSYPCCICKQAFGDLESRRAHMAAAHPGEFPFACGSCDAAYLQKAMLRKHELTHTGVKEFTCDTCGAAFYRKDVLKSHVVKHMAVKPYLCSVCGEGFTERGNMKRHERTHGAEKNFLCSFCAAAFLEKSDLQRHVRIHTGEKRFLCRHCRMPFSDYSSRTAHLKTQHKEHLLPCSVCGATFVDKTGLKLHQKRHNKDFTCVLCEETFRSNSELRSHVAVHVGGRTHACGTCGASFAQRGNLRRHERIHTGEKPYSCDVCGVGFSESGTLKRHQKTHKAEKTHACVICEAAFPFRVQLKKHMAEAHAV